MSLLSPLPSFEFRLKDAASRNQARLFVDTLIASKRFYRNEKSQIMFAVAPGDYVMIVHKSGLRSIIEDGNAVEVTGDLGDACTDLCWFWVLERKWTLPRLNPERPWIDPRPAARNRDNVIKDSGPVSR